VAVNNSIKVGPLAFLL